MVEMTGLDLAGGRAHQRRCRAYDYLISPSGETNYFGLDAVQRHGFGLKDVAEAVAIRNQVLGCFERAMLESDPATARVTHLRRVGGGPTGWRWRAPCPS